MATINGTAGSDTLVGTSSRDFIDTRGGVDKVDAGGGNDTVRISGSVPDGNQVAGIIDGGSGHDILDLTHFEGHLLDYDVGGFLGFFELSPDNHYTWVGYVRNFEEVHLGTGVDYFSAYQASTGDPATVAGWKIVGSAGVDNIEDSRGYDEILSGAGNDVIHYRGGGDQVDLGDGDDIFSMETNTGFADHLVIDGGTGTDLVEVNRFSLGQHMDFDLAAGTAQVGTTGFTLTGVENVTVDALDASAQDGRTIHLAGDAGANFLTATDDADTILLGRGGNDVLTGGQLQHGFTAFG